MLAIYLDRNLDESYTPKQIAIEADGVQQMKVEL